MYEKREEAEARVNQERQVLVHAQGVVSAEVDRLVAVLTGLVEHDPVRVTASFTALFKAMYPPESVAAIAALALVRLAARESA
ncbi:MAG: hypothetical protein ACRDTZ_16335 [Pseudonocardiaceae bacterium]